MRGYRTFQHWNKWLTEKHLGNDVLNVEHRYLSNMLSNHFGKHALLIGTPAQASLLSASTIPCHTIISPLPVAQKGFVEGDFRELPILTGSMDLVILPHALELVDHPRQLLAEACRVTKPEGLIVISGFNPMSLWGLSKSLRKGLDIPWPNKLLPPSTVKNWLDLADFNMEQYRSMLFRPPIENLNIYNKLHWLESVGKKCTPLLGGVYISVARAKVIPLTPIKLKWKQAFGGIRLPNMAGHIARHTNIKSCK